MNGADLALALPLGWVVFAYLGYPLLCAGLARFAPRPVRRQAIAPPLSIVVTAHDEEHALASKLESTLALHYPGDRELLVASDGSRDGTEAIAREFADRGVRLVALPERGGKEAAQAAAIAKTRGEIVLFTDVAAELEPDALCALVAPFADPGVAAVSSEDAVDDGGGEGAYVRFEMWLRRRESEAGTLLGLSGSCFAVRRELCDPWPHDLASDFRSALEAVRRGHRAVCAPDARASFRTARDPGHEWRRKVRTVRRGLTVLAAYRGLLHPRYGRAALGLWGHKVARFTAPFALVALLLASVVSAPGHGPSALLLGLQGLAYTVAGLTLALPVLARFAPARIAAFFLLVNASILVAWYWHLRGEKVVTWQPTRR